MCFRSFLLQSRSSRDRPRRSYLSLSIVTCALAVDNLKFVYHSPIDLPDHVRNYELKGMYFNQLPSYHGLPNEDALTFMRTFYGTVENFPRNGLTNEELRMRCIPYTLKDRANAWWLSLPAGSLTTWDQVYERFVGKFYSHSKTMSLRQQICTFAQHEDEPFHEAWACFK